MSLNWNLFNSSGNATITQTSAASASPNSSQNGFPSGTYNGFTVDASGLVTAQFSNGQPQTVGQIAVANVANVEGLTRAGDNNYLATAASGAAAIGTAGTGGLGTVDDEALESSNVNISTEFTNLIVAQRAFEANSKTVTTFDTLTQETIDMIR